MSFLNPVNEPVLRFSSTDASAPQINYNARVAGDVKAVLKACLVTGYGAKASAGWSIVNEVNHVAEFVSPSAAMSDYRLGIDDTSTASTTWYHQYNNSRVNPTNNTPIKALTRVDKTHIDNGWQLFVTSRGILFVELLQSTEVNKLTARMTYWSQVKSALQDEAGNNIIFFNIGHNGQVTIPPYFYSRSDSTYLRLGSYTSAILSAANINMLTSNSADFNVSVVDLVSPIYLANSNLTITLAEMPGLLSKTVNDTNNVYGVSGINVGGRPAFSVCAGRSDVTGASVIAYGRTFLIYLDYWEY